MRTSNLLAALSTFTASTMGFSSTYTTSNTCINDKENNTMPKFRSVKRVMERPHRHWVGDAFHVYPVFADLAFKEDLSPLLMFDYAAPKNFAPTLRSPRGVGQHPHRGFETVTIAFQGEVEHHDSKGNTGVIGAGDVQWMTAGRGIIHEEYHSKKFTREGGTFEMCQLWVNLPKKHKMTKPRYQPILNDDIPTVALPLTKTEQPADTDVTPLATVRLIAGEIGDIKGAAKTFSPVQVWDVLLPHSGVDVDIPFPSSQNCIVFVRRGGVRIVSRGDENGKHGNKASVLGPQDVAVMHLDRSDALRVRVDEPDTSLLILGGEPLNEPIAHRGPFVMNTHEQLQRAMMDYHLGKF